MVTKEIKVKVRRRKRKDIKPGWIVRGNPAHHIREIG